ncbi:DNA topoisomerase I-interacting protein [Plasmopara halstedii]|uniref:DNA topoisomerase I-interacting protein n=1 Tax=Plasmopara halstedii TaxID=4781 RepID=A0A0P1AMI8_PLAHL|nr:DNA topoisomerase I-interacting protein [Plasmopara halstedii]CEG42156.1 DNA topoisomerase I-interacting protein [Plasmopara halstedii]|eukprot:XP_024578525.1 DNA topoisomerase I-interacting protein [Plasmopara halstedii]
MADSTTQVNDAIKRDESTASIERNDPETSAERGEELEDFAMSSSDEETDANEPQLDAAMMNELLLVCSNLGMLRVQTEGEPPMLMRGENCTEWIHDLQRAIRRDHAKYKLVAKQLGKWKILQKKLLPLLVNHQHDLTLVLSILKVLVMLTMKPSRESTNIALQLKYLRHYKHEFLRYGVISIMMTILLDPLSRKRPRTDQDYLYIEIVLTLIRNLLAIPNEDPRFVTSTTSFFSHLQEDLICTLHEESVYEMILLFAQDIDSPESRDWNLLIMEILCLTLESSQPKSVVSFTKKELMSGTNSCLNDQQSALTRSSLTIEKKIPTQHDLLAKLDDEKKASAMPQSRSRRHSNFGGVLTIVGPTGRTSVLSDFSKAMYDQVPQAAKKPISRKRGQKSTSSTTDFHEIFGGKGRVTESDERTMRVLREICDSIVAKSYAQLTNSLKTEFRRGSNKLISTDRLQYFYLVWFLTTYHRLRIQMLKSHYKHQLKIIQKKTKESQNALGVTPTPHVAIEKPSYDEKAVLSTLDMFSFNFVLQSIENYATMKNYHGMTVSVQLLTEMMAYLAELTASDDSRLQRIADSLQHKIFYERDFLDRIPVLLKTWSPGLFPKAYVVDVVTLTHLVFKVLDSQGSIKVLSRRKAYLSKKGQKKIDDESKNEEEADGSSTDEEESERHTQLLMEMQRKEADFDVRRYFLSMVSGDTVRMYTSLLAEYRDNSSKVNHYIHSFFYRTKHFQIYQQEKWTMQPMLFNIHVLLVFNKMLHDTYIQRLPEYTTFLDFIRGVVCDFFALADKNNLLLVEVFLRQTYPSKSCMLIQRCYDPIDSMSKSRSKAVALGKDKQIEALNESRRQRIALDHEDLEGETEFQFSLEPECATPSKPCISNTNQLIQPSPLSLVPNM